MDRSGQPGAVVGARPDALSRRPTGGPPRRRVRDPDERRRRDLRPQVDGYFLLLRELERIVFTNAVDSEWRPASPEPVAMTAEVTLRDHEDGTDYRIVVRHGDPAARNRHAELGFADGWGTVADQLTRFVESAR